MRPTGVRVVSVNQDLAFQPQHLLKLGTKLDYLTVVTRVSCASVLCCAVRLEGKDCSTFDPYSSDDSKEVILGF